MEIKGRDIIAELLNPKSYYVFKRICYKMENKEIKKAKEVLEEISQDEHERYLAELRQKNIMNQKATEDAGYDKGLRSE